MCWVGDNMAERFAARYGLGCISAAVGAATGFGVHAAGLADPWGALGAGLAAAGGVWALAIAYVFGRVIKYD